MADGDDVLRAAGDASRRGVIVFDDLDNPNNPPVNCKTVDLSSEFSEAAGPLRAQVAIDHRDSTQANRDATTAWVQWVSTTKIKVCVRELSYSFGNGGLHQDGLSVSYMVYDGAAVASARRSGRTSGLQMSGDTIDCTWIPFDEDTDNNDAAFVDHIPVVHASLYNPQGLGDVGATVWLEEIELDRFKACARTTAVDDPGGATYTYAIDWYAFQLGANRQGANLIDGYAAKSGSFSASDDPAVALDDWTNIKLCETVSFSGFSETPDLFLTVDHLSSGGHDATTVWVEDLDSDSAEICFKELADEGDPGNNATNQHRANLRMTWTAIESP
ncbi:hypothetical protein DB30_04518 [Enhygromyxa salina]|uniref:Uncharacterized protein n=1 Tax=Enhygromyxa salina TaxID=215803 RepID=A0A0C2CZF2_9BACT|nr:hypothetical protein DB30_04518 [Enhygromyxa salina]